MHPWINAGKMCKPQMRQGENVYGVLNSLRTVSPGKSYWVFTFLLCPEGISPFLGTERQFGCTGLLPCPWYLDIVWTEEGRER